MPPRPSPTADLARMYRERIPTAPKSIGRQAPAIFSSGRNFGFLAPVGRFVKTAVESMDPRFIASEGGRSVQHVVGDATELGRSIITGKDTLSESPTARTYQAAGGGAPGVLAAALPYVNVGTAVLPTTKVLTPAGRAALGADAAERLAQKQILASIDRPPTVGVHISERPGLSQISPRSVGQRQVTARDAIPGSSYMWDARSPQMLEQLFPDDPLTISGTYGETPSLYVTKPQGQVFADSNVPVSPALRVQGPQQVLAEIPYDKQALLTYLQKLGVVERGATADKLEQMYRSLSPMVEQQIANRGNQMAEEGVRMAVNLGKSGAATYLGLSSLDPNAPLGELLTNTQARELYDYLAPKYVQSKPALKRDFWAVRPIHPNPR